VRGNVLGFDPDTNTGAISGHDGNRYDFVTAEWRGASRPQRGDIVDFQAIERRATEIYLVEPSYVAPGFGQFYFSPKGRISRSQYWLRFVLPYAAIVFALDIVVAIAGQGSTVGAVFSGLLSLFSLVALCPSIAVLVKRIHDRNKSGLLALVLFIPAALFGILAVIWVVTTIVAVGIDQATSGIVPALGVLGVIVIVSGVIVLAIDLWFFVEFGCLRGTIGPNRFGPDPVKR